MKREDLSGIIEQNGERVYFVEKDFVFTLMAQNPYIPKVRPEVSCIKPDVNGYVHGVTYNGNSIAIYIGNQELEFVAQMTLISACYIIAQGNTELVNIDSFQGVEYIGGTLNILYPCSLQYDQDVNSSIMDFHSFADKQGKKNIYFEDTDNEGVIKVAYGCSEEFSKGIRCVKCIPYMRLELKKDTALVNFLKYHHYVISLFQFLTFRNNVGFDEIKLLKKDEILSTEDETVLMDYVTCFIRKKECTNKDSYRAITLKKLSDDNISNLLKIIMKNEEDKPSYCVNFLPDNDDSITIMDNERLRNIISGVECEISIIEEKSRKKKESRDSFDILLADIKKLIKDHRKGENALDERTYDRMFGDMRHWKKSLADIIWELCELHREEMQPLLKEFRMIRIRKESIDELVKYRNNITHGMYKVGNHAVSLTAFLLIGIIYCCILTRAGVEKEIIKEIMDSGIFLYT